MRLVVVGKGGGELLKLGGSELHRLRMGDYGFGRSRRRFLLLLAQLSVCVVAATAAAVGIR